MIKALREFRGYRGGVRVKWPEVAAQVSKYSRNRLMVLGNDWILHPI